MNLERVSTTRPAWLVSLGDGLHVGFEMGQSPNVKRGLTIFLSEDMAKQKALLTGGKLVMGLAGELLALAVDREISAMFIDELGTYLLPISVVPEGETIYGDERRFIQ